MTNPRELQVGDRVRDNAGNKMGKHREMIVDLIVDEASKGHRVLLSDDSSSTFTEISLSRIHLDDKPRKTGWSRV